MASTTPPLYGGVCLRRISNNNVEPTIPSSVDASIPSGIVKKIKEQHEGGIKSAAGNNKSTAGSNKNDEGNNMSSSGSSSLVKSAQAALTAKKNASGDKYSLPSKPNNSLTSTPNPLCEAIIQASRDYVCRAKTTGSDGVPTLDELILATTSGIEFNNDASVAYQYGVSPRSSKKTAPKPDDDTIYSIQTEIKPVESYVSTTSSDRYKTLSMPLQELNSHDVPSMNWNGRSRQIINESRSVVSSSNENAKPWENKAQDSPRNKEILQQFQRRIDSLNSMESPRRAASPKHTSNHALKRINSYESNRIPALTSYDSSLAPPPLLSLTSVDTADESILETQLCRKFLTAFEETVRKNPGLLPGDDAVLAELKQVLDRVMEAKKDEEMGMHASIEKVHLEKHQIEERLNKKREELTSSNEELKDLLEQELKQQQLLQDQVQTTSQQVETLKTQLEQRTNEASQDKEQMTLHLNQLRVSRDEISSSLKKEQDLIQVEKASLSEVADTRRFIQVQKDENKALESKIEVLTEVLSQRKKGLQDESAQIKLFEGTLMEMKSSNDRMAAELQEEKKELLARTRELQNEKAKLLEAKQLSEREMEREQLEFENPPSPVDNGSRSSKGSLKGVDIESIIKSRVDAEMKKKDMVRRERELERREKELYERSGVQCTGGKLGDDRSSVGSIRSKVLREMGMSVGSLERRRSRAKLRSSVGSSRGMEDGSALDERDDKSISTGTKSSDVEEKKEDRPRLTEDPLTGDIELWIDAEIKRKESELEASRDQLQPSFSSLRHAPSSDSARQHRIDYAFRHQTSSTSTEVHCNTAYNGRHSGDIDLGDNDMSPNDDLAIVSNASTATFGAEAQHSIPKRAGSLDRYAVSSLQSDYVARNESFTPEDGPPELSLTEEEFNSKNLLKDEHEGEGSNDNELQTSAYVSCMMPRLRR